MAQVKVGAGRIHAQLDIERRALGQLLLELFLRHDLHRARLDDFHLLLNAEHSPSLAAASHDIF